MRSAQEAAGRRVGKTRGDCDRQSAAHQFQGSSLTGGGLAPCLFSSIPSVSQSLPVGGRSRMGRCAARRQTGAWDGGMFAHRYPAIVPTHRPIFIRMEREGRARAALRLHVQIIREPSQRICQDRPEKPHPSSFPKPVFRNATRHHTGTGPKSWKPQPRIAPT